MDAAEVLQPLPTKITHDSFVELARLKSITVSDKRFKELTRNTPLDVLDELTALKVIAHLRQLEAYAAHYYNVIADRLETNQIKQFIDPKEIASDVTPHLIDTRSIELWPK